MTRSFDPSGKEDTAKTRYAYNFDELNETGRAVLYQAFGYSQDQLTGLADRAREVLEANPLAGQGLAGLLANDETPEQAAETLTVYFSSQSGYA